MGEDTLSDFLSLSLCSNSVLDFFSLEIPKHKVWQELLLECYAESKADKFQRLDEGVMQTRHAEGQIKNINSLTEQCQMDNWIVCYSEKRRPVYLLLSSDNRISIVNQNNKPRHVSLNQIKSIDSEFEKQYDICLSVPMRSLLNDLLLLDKVEIGNGKKHPFYNDSYSGCSNHLKLLCLICCCYGFTAHQMVEIIELAKCYEASSCKLVEALCIVKNLSFDERKVLLGKLNSLYECPDRNILMCDCLYMLRLGDYSCEKVIEAIEFIAELLGISQETVFKVYNDIVRRIEL